MKQTLLLSFTVFTCLIARGQQNKVKPIDSLMRAVNEIGLFNRNILVAKNKRIIHHAEIGYADTTRTTLLRPELRLAIGSITKEFNGTSILMRFKKLPDH